MQTTQTINSIETNLISIFFSFLFFLISFYFRFFLFLPFLSLIFLDTVWSGARSTTQLKPQYLRLRFRCDGVCINQSELRHKNKQTSTLEIGTLIMV